MNTRIVRLLKVALMKLVALFHFTFLSITFLIVYFTTNSPAVLLLFFLGALPADLFHALTYIKVTRQLSERPPLAIGYHDPLKDPSVSSYYGSFTLLSIFAVLVLSVPVFLGWDNLIIDLSDALNPFYKFFECTTSLQYLWVDEASMHRLYTFKASAFVLLLAITFFFSIAYKDSWLSRGVFKAHSELELLSFSVVDVAVIAFAAKYYASSWRVADASGGLLGIPMDAEQHLIVVSIILWIAVVCLRALGFEYLTQWKILYSRSEH